MKRDDSGCGRPGHFGMVDVDDYNVVHWTCYYPGGVTMHGDARIIETTTPLRAEAIRRAARAYLAYERGRAS